MASKADAPSAQSKTFQVLSQIDGQFCNDEVVVRLIHFWEARNFKKGNILMGLELLLLDAENNAVKPEKRNYVLTVIEFEAKILEIEEVSQDAAYWIRRIPPRLWATAYFEGQRRQLMTWFNERRETSMQWTSILVPTAEWRVAEAFEIARTYQTWFLAAFDSRENK
ncbi:unnamed protein product [Microthlaspi erraticum]|uniref:DUF223 domain-containing protein n=1 Tax=Microthlaspi erraticum TaxID=1685480 RepID=A0A6D2KA79_9BRAS|nr:unnamed protein product [Microthlaspi erraticum]CAA7049071.1 unnamed protein product [Microthlaspi erraticum]